jgi:hypothetical protein
LFTCIHIGAYNIVQTISRPFKYVYMNYAMKTFRFSLTLCVRKTKSNTITIIQHAHVCIYYIIYQYVLLFVTLISIRLFNYYSPRTQSFRCALVMCKQKCIFYGSPPYGVHYIILLFYYNIYIYIYMCARVCVLQTSPPRTTIAGRR